MGHAWDREHPFDAESSEVTRLLCQAVHVRPDRVGARRGGRKPAQAPPPRRSRRRRVPLEGADPCPPLGEPMQRWIIDNVLRGPSVPSYGFDAVAVAAQALAGRRHHFYRRFLIFAVVVGAVVLMPLAAVLWAIPLLIVPALVNHDLRRRHAILLLPVAIAGWRTDPDRAWTPELGRELVVLPFLVFGALVLVFAADRLLANWTTGRLSRYEAAPVPVLTGPRARRRLDRLRRAERGVDLPYNADERFIGAGRDAWSAAVIGMPLRLRRPDVRPGRLDDGELLHHVATALRRPDDLTERLPHLTAEPVVGMPTAMWLGRTGATKVDLAGLGGRAPSGRPDRVYLRVQSISWDGQIVVNVFVHAALEGGELRLTVRPQVGTPLHRELFGTGPVRLAPRFLGNVLLDVLGLLAGLWRKADASVARPKETPPVSLRDRYSMEEAIDMHQNDDAKRHVTLIQRRVFLSVQSYLYARGVDTTSFQKQASDVINMINIYGDNIAPIQNAGDGSAQRS